MPQASEAVAVPNPAVDVHWFVSVLIVLLLGQLLITGFVKSCTVTLATHESDVMPSLIVTVTPNVPTLPQPTFVLDSVIVAPGHTVEPPFSSAKVSTPEPLEERVSVCERHTALLPHVRHWLVS
jgi:hypothetical protein